MAKIWVPAGKIPSKNREFSAVVADARHAVFSVHRLRPNGTGNYDATPLGSGFFVSSSVFVTCAHVINPKAVPHQTGDIYRLVNNLDGKVGIIHEVNGGIGKDIHIFPDDDFAILQSSSKKDQAYFPVGYSDVPVGSDIGVAGYPLAQLTTDANGHLTLAGIVYRVASRHFSQLGRRGIKFVEVGAARYFRGVVLCSGSVFRWERGISVSAGCSGAQLTRRGTEARKRLFAVVLFQYFTGMAHSFS